MLNLKKILKKDKEKFIIPKSVQDCIPIKAIYEDGIFLLSSNKYSKCFRFTDINYAVASDDDKKNLFLKYSELLNSFDTGATTKITILNRKLNKVDFEKNIMIPKVGDDLDEYRDEYNKMLMNKSIGNNSIIQEKYLTVTVIKKNIEEARTYFRRTSIELNTHFNQLGSKCIELNTEDRMRLIHDFYRIGEENIFTWNSRDILKKGHSFKDYICPDTFSFNDDYFEMGDKFGRVFFLKDYANFIRDDMVSELTDLNRNLILSIDLLPIPKDVAIRLGEKVRLGVETNITNWQRRQNNNNNFSAIIPYDMGQERDDSIDFLNDMTARDQRMFLSVLTMVIIADSKEKLDEDTESLLTISRKHLCQLAKMKYQQLLGLNITLPIGNLLIDQNRSLTTESIAVFMPFRVQEIQQENGIYYGQNVISKNMIIADRRQLLNGNSFILGVSGSGKSFAAKNEIVSIALRDKDADIIIIDPEREYFKLVEKLGGQVIRISATSDNHINPMDLNANYSDEGNPVILKSEFMLSLCESLIGANSLGAKEKSIIDRCTAKVYRAYQQGNYMGVAPTLQDFREELSKQPEKEANDIAVAMELYTNGSLNTFAKNTNVDINNRIVCYDILELDKSLKTFGMLVVLDAILNRITINRQKGKNTYIFIDEIYLLFQQEYSANFLFTLWKRVRKYGAFCTGITQNVDDLLQSHTARTMLANSEFLIILNQSGTDVFELSKLLSISDTQEGYIKNVDVGEGLLKIGSSLIPFKNEFPTNLKLYKLMTTKPNEK